MTEVERTIRARRGQEIFRSQQLIRWRGRCCLTGLDVPELLTASHIRAWAACETDEERLDVHNGLLLAAHLDRAFDRSLMTIGPDGAVQWSSTLTEEHLRQLGVLDHSLAVLDLVPQQEVYLRWHRAQLL